MIKMSKIINKCKNCKNCREHTIRRTTRNGKIIETTYCEMQKDIFERYNWSQNPSGYQHTSVKTDNGKYMYATDFFKNNPENQIDHIDGQRNHHSFKNITEVTQTENLQNKHNGDFHFFNVRRNTRSWTAFKKTADKTITLGCYSSDILAFHNFVLYCHKNYIPIYTNTPAYQIYLAIKDIGFMDSGVTFYAGGICHAKV